MDDSSLVSHQLQVPAASREGKAHPGMSGGPFNNKVPQPVEIVSRRNSLAQNVSQEPHICTGRMLGRPRPSAHQPPINFSTVCDGLYRSGYPETPDYPFLQSLGLKTIVTLVDKELPDGYQEFMRDNQITHRIFDMAGTKKEDIPIEMMRSIHAVVSDRANYPLLVHCKQGRHRTGCVVGVLRKSNQWNIDCIIDEYTAHAEPKVRDVDIKYLNEFELTRLLHPSQAMSSSRKTGRLYSRLHSRFCRLAVVTVLVFLAWSPLNRFHTSESSLR
ncbi:tyrosine phosphatase family-domain-containing protein [Xylaria arbuscula]|nr:tyrosine phosphatase family-domain-containing protein [Xylaria arbuscula]